MPNTTARPDYSHQLRTQVFAIVDYQLQLLKRQCKNGWDNKDTSFFVQQHVIKYITEIAVHLAVACDVFDGVFLCCPFSHEMS